MLDRENLSVGRGLGIASEKVAREVDGIEARLGRESQELTEIHRLRVGRVLQAEVQLDVERVGVERRTQARELAGRRGLGGAGG